MRFIVLVKSNPESEAGVLPDEAMLSEMGKYNEELVQSGALLAGDGLKASSHGARVQIGGGKTRHLDGPFAESKELVAGYWLLQFPSYDQAIATLARAPFHAGEIELRPLYESEDFAIDPSERPGGFRDQEQAARRAAESGQGPKRSPGTKRFLCMLKADRYTEGEDRPTPALLSEMGALIEEMNKAGVLLLGEGLKPTRYGKRIVFEGEAPRVVDGPFAEAKELVAGLSLLQTRTRAEAEQWSRRMLDIHVRGVGLNEGQIEIRELFELEDFPVSPEERPDGWRAQERALRDR